MQGAVPELLGDFQLVERVATGGMASLYLGRRVGARGFVKPVAVKVFHPDLAEDKEFVDMFVDEAHILARLSHPNIVHVEELGEDQGFLFLVMEFVDGCSLRGALKQARQLSSPISVPLAVHLIAAAADGLHYAHEARDESRNPLGIVHRDVSPTNIMLSHDGHIKVIDFGIAKSEEQVHQTTFRRLKGKVAYMSPEQVACTPVDRRSDVYSLGLVLWEILANRRAFQASDEISLIYEVSSTPLPAINTLRRDLPKELVETLAWATERDISSRIPSAHTFRKALLRAVPEALEVPESQVGAVAHRVTGSKSTGWTPPHKRIRQTGGESTNVDTFHSYHRTPTSPSTSFSQHLNSNSDAHVFSQASQHLPPPQAHIFRSILLGTVTGFLLLWCVLAWAGYISTPSYITQLIRGQTVLSRGASPDIPVVTVQNRKNNSFPAPSIAPQPNPSHTVNLKDEESAASNNSDASLPLTPAMRFNATPSLEDNSAPAPDRTDISPPNRRSATPNPKKNKRSSTKKATRKAPQPNSVEIDGYILARPNELDKASKPSKAKNNASTVEQDDIILADEYQ